jgi:predicted HicB family RNase H-like nuclease
MAVSKAQQKAVNKYVKENYDRVNVNMPKGQKDKAKAHAETQGESLNAFINRAITETMERDNTAGEAPEA